MLLAQPEENKRSANKACVALIRPANCLLDLACVAFPGVVAAMPSGLGHIAAEQITDRALPLPAGFWSGERTAGGRLSAGPSARGRYGCGMDDHRHIQYAREAPFMVCSAFKRCRRCSASGRRGSKRQGSRQDREFDLAR
jgi:hypothetical protein